MLTILLLTFCPRLAAQTDSIGASREIGEVRVFGVQGKEGMGGATHYGLTSETFSRLSVSDLSAALRRLPAITLRDYGGAGGMKTVSVRGMGSGHTGVAFDGLLLPDAQSGQMDLQQFSLSEMGSLSLFPNGSADVFQPARNLSRASLLTITTPQDEGVRVSLAAGSWGRIAPSAYLSRTFGRTFVSLQGGYCRAENDYEFLIKNGVETHRERRKNSRAKQGYAGGAVVWRPNAQSSLTTTLRLSHDDRRLPGAVHLYANDNDEALRDRSVLAQSVLSMAPASKWRFRAAARWYAGEQRYHNGQPAGGIESERYLSREYYATVSVLYMPTAGLDLSYCADYWHDAVLTSVADRRHVHRNSFLHALSAKYSFRRLTVTGQALNSVVSDDRHVSPFLSAAYRVIPNRELYIKLTARDIFRMPTVTEMYYYHLGNRDLKPEKARQMELGIAFRHGADDARGFCVEASAGAYLNSVHDKIVAIPVNMFVFRYLNVEKTAGKGMDCMINMGYGFASGSRLLLSASYALQEIEDRPENEAYAPRQIAYTPRHSGSGSIAWENKWVCLSTSLTAASAAWAANEHNAGTRIAGYAEWGASLYRTFRLRTGAIEAKASADNILSHNYCIVARYPMPGRNWNFCLTYKY